MLKAVKSKEVEPGQFRVIFCTKMQPNLLKGMRLRSGEHTFIVSGVEQSAGFPTVQLSGGPHPPEGAIFTIAYENVNDLFGSMFGGGAR